MDLLKEYPLKVVYPHGGARYLLFWRTDWEGTKMIVSKSESSLVITLRSITTKHKDLSLSEYWKVEIVSPTEEMKQRYANSMYRHDLADFKNRWQSDIEDYTELRGRPSGLIPCKSYQYIYEGLDGDPDPPTEDRRHPKHYLCANCFSGWRIPGVSMESIFMRFRTREEKENKVISKAPPPNAQDAIHYVGMDFGHHRKGLECLYARDGFLWNVMFFFQGEQLPIPEEVRRIVEEVKAETEAEEASKMALWKEAEKESQNELVSRVESFLNSIREGPNDQTYR